jgi:hypothetical protein
VQLLSFSVPYRSDMCHRGLLRLEYTPLAINEDRWSAWKTKFKASIVPDVVMIRVRTCTDRFLYFHHRGSIVCHFSVDISHGKVEFFLI